MTLGGKEWLVAPHDTKQTYFEHPPIPRTVPQRKLSGLEPQQTEVERPQQNYHCQNRYLGRDCMWPSEHQTPSWKGLNPCFRCISTKLCCPPPSFNHTLHVASTTTSNGNFQSRTSAHTGLLKSRLEPLKVVQGPDQSVGKEIESKLLETFWHCHSNQAYGQCFLFSLK